jgi:hypothetical protein
VFCRLDGFEGYDRIAEREPYSHHHLYDDLHGHGWYRLGQYRRHGRAPTQHDFKRRADFARRWPAGHLNVVRHQCDGVFCHLDGFEGYDRIAEREPHGHHHLYDDLHRHGWYRLGEYYGLD